jgi:predicted ABC-type ATPase
MEFPLVPTKELLVVAGPNGAGKSTFVAEFLSAYPRPYLCADLVATEFPHLDPISQQIAAGREFLRRMEGQLAKEENFAVETTLSGRTMQSFLARARTAGCEITIVFIYLDSADTCVVRVSERVRRGGHNVPEDDIRRRFFRSCANFWHVYREIADQWAVYYNAGSGFVEVAFGFPDGFAVSDDGLFGRFLEFAENANHG